MGVPACPAAGSAVHDGASAGSCRKASHGETRYQRLGQAAVAVASFPDLVRESFTTVRAAADEKVRVPRAAIDLAGFQPIKTSPGIPLEGLMVRVDDAALARASGWRILVGGFTLDGALENAALLLSPRLQVVKVWPLQGKEHPRRAAPRGQSEICPRLCAPARRLARVRIRQRRVAATDRCLR